ncbi:hypothetical protein Btru_067148 [Bulinus truncatus]|nr:hypothetical protein Btru_067148 [Bulinus truncatus]
MWINYIDLCASSLPSPHLHATVRSIPAEIEALNLICNSYARSSYLSPDIFGRFTSLRSLGIGQCNVTSLTASSFRGLSNLVDLSIGSSILPELGEDAFEHLPSLGGLTIVETNMKKLPSLSHMTSLRRVNVSFNALQEVTDRPTNSTTPLFHHDLTEVDLSYNSFASVPMEILRGTSSLRKLYLKGLTAVSGLHFPADLDLGKLTICTRMAQTSRPWIFPGIHIADGRLDGLDSLEFFDANDNRLTFVVPHMVTRVSESSKPQPSQQPDHRCGDIRGSPESHDDQNKLKTVRPNWFPVSITSITLGANEISEFFSTSFKNLNNLTFVNLYMNKVALSMPSYSVNVFKANSPKPVFEMKYNTFLCSCNKADIKVIMEDGYVNNVFNNNYPSSWDWRPRSVLRPRHSRCTAHGRRPSEPLRMSL